VTKHSDKTAARVGRPAKSDEDAAAGRIIDAATELFANRGFAGTSMEQVASQCGAGKDTVYRRFPSKVALFEAVVQHAHGRAVERVSRLPSVTGTPLEQLRALLLELLHINMEPELIALKRITFSESVVFAKAGPIPSQPDPLMEQLVAAVLSAQRAEMIAKGNASQLASHLIHCLVAQPTSSAMMGSEEFQSRDAVDAHFERTWAWLAQGVAI
jgi:TetR/AcrR family transcriptional regulator of autoinduction and epiphytic fitness